MRQVGNVVEIGIERNGEFGEPERLPEEIEAIAVVMGGTVQEGLDQLVAAARERCPNANCCLSAVITPDSAEGGSWDPHPMNDTTYKVPFTRVDVSCSKEASRCGERADRLTDGIAFMAKRCIGVMEEADAAGQKITDAVAREAESTINTPLVEEARETIKAAETRADEIKSDGETEAQEARDAVYAQTREEIAASLSEVAAA